MLNKSKLDLFEQGLVGIGQKILEWRDDPTLRKITEPKEFKTVGDKKAHGLIVDLIKSIFGDVSIISEEEEYVSSIRPDEYWLIDPIDGTASWYEGFDGFVTQAAFIRKNVPVYGIVVAPSLSKCWTASQGKGSFLNGEKLSQLSVLSRINLIDNYPEPRRISKTLFQNLAVDTYIECGSFGLKSCLVADGTADLFVKDVVFRDWDVAPVMVILQEVGGVILDLTGNVINLTGKFVKNDGLMIARHKDLAMKALKVTGNQ